MSSKLNGVKTVAIFCGSKCNYNCVYCDRIPIKESVGYTALRLKDVPQIVRFLEDISETVPCEECHKAPSVMDDDGNIIPDICPSCNGTKTRNYLPIDTISFFGGEPFLFFPVMEAVVEQVIAKWPKMFFFIQTNGSYLTEPDKETFIRKYAKNLRVSISHDFSFQSLNRTEFDIGAALTLLKDAKVDFVQMQHVLPVNRPDAFSIDHVASIVKIFARYKVDRLSLIPLRHIRGFGRFTTFVKEVPLDILFRKMLQLVHKLWVEGINVVVDGMEQAIEKSYFNDHKQLVIAPDGYLYPEFDFVEYKVHGARVGEWLNKTELNRSTNDDHLIWDKCKTCPARNQCGIKYLYKMFSDEEPDGYCLHVNRMYMTIINHNLKLKKSKNLFDLVGI